MDRKLLPEKYIEFIGKCLILILGFGSVDECFEHEKKSKYLDNTEKKK